MRLVLPSNNIPTTDYSDKQLVGNSHREETLALFTNHPIESIQSNKSCHYLPVKEEFAGDEGMQNNIQLLNRLRVLKPMLTLVNAAVHRD